jgi:hypothetical protein
MPIPSSRPAPKAINPQMLLMPSQGQQQQQQQQQQQHQNYLPSVS